MVNVQSLENEITKTKLKMFVFLITIGLGSSFLLLHIDWDFYGQCLEEGLIPSFSDGERSCTRITIPDAFAMCIENEDWPEAPCLDSIGNGWYNQDQVDRWSDYYSYKGSIFMEKKYLELADAIREDRVEEWNEESTENRNVYEYYFFSGRAPNTGEYHGAFDVIAVNEEGTPEYSKPTFVNLTPILTYDYGLINLVLVIGGLSAGIVGAVVWRKRK